VGSKLRKLYIWFVSFAILFAIYTLYTHIGGAPNIDIPTASPPAPTLPKSDLDAYDDQAGTVGGVGIDVLTNTEYFIPDKKTKKIVGVFGFEELLYERANELELKNPYVELYSADYTYRITADRGTVQVEKTPGGTRPKDGKFSQNVVVRIIPRKPGNAAESFVYLDDLILIGERSQFSTLGPVRFVSQNTQMLAKGLEGVYNSETHRLVYLRITDLKSLRSKTLKSALLSPAETKPDKPIQKADDAQKAKTSQEPDTPPVPQEQGQYFKCLFSKSVVVDSSKHLVFAEDEFSISSILWPSDSNDEPNKTNVAPKPQEASVKPAGKAPTPAAEPNDPNAAPPQLVEVLITCDNGILLTPMASSKSISDFPKPTPRPPSAETRLAAALRDANDRTTLIAKKVDYSKSTDQTVITGPLALTFYPNDVPLTGIKTTKDAPLPVKITARKQAKFLPDSNQVIFEGSCQATTLRVDPNGTRKFTLSAPKITLDLFSQTPNKPSDPALGIKHLTAAGGTVSLASITKDPNDKQTSAVELKCRRFDFNAVDQMFLAAGPGMIALDNSGVPEPNTSDPNADQDRFGLHQPCWVVIRDFDTLTYFLDANQIIADAPPDGTLRIDYFPVVDANVQYDQQAVVTAAHIEAFLHKPTEDQFELSTLNATGGVTYRDRDKQFEGSTLFYDEDKHLMTIRGDQSRPCFFNGAPVDAIEWNLKTDNLKFEIKGPGTL
jgi:hypothetical protein